MPASAFRTSRLPLPGKTVIGSDIDVRTGGKSSNQAAAAARLGATVAMVGAVGDDQYAKILRATTVLVVNEDELACLSGASEDVVDGDVAQRVLGSIGIRNAVVTLWADGALVLTPAGVTHLEAPRVKAVDTTGSGDAFTGALATGLAEERSLTDAARLGNATGACAATRAGAQTSYPSRREVEEMLRSAMQASRPV